MLESGIWGHSVLQTPALVMIYLIKLKLDLYLDQDVEKLILF